MPQSDPFPISEFGINRGEFKIRGFRNRDIRPFLFKGKATAWQAASVTRKFALLRAHGLIKKVGGTHRYVLTEKGAVTTTALLTARQANIHELTKLAA